MIIRENRSSLLFAMAAALLVIAVIAYGIIARRSILVMVCFSLLLAIILYPLFRRMDRWAMGRVWAIIVSLIVSTALVGGVFSFVIVHIGSFISEILKGE